MTAGDSSIHETAIVEPGARIGTGTHVWHHSHVRDGAVIGRDCTLGKNVFVDATVVIGDRVKVQNNVSVYRGVTLEDEVFVGPSAVFTNDQLPRASSPDWQITPTLVREGASIGANATIVCGSEIGRWAMVGAGSVVTRSVAPHQLVVGVPARPAGWVCRCGAVVSREASRPASFECAGCEAAAR
ncbi:MAG TPA: acyltransferase [Acidimicrobiales bacterium]|nr:acyltransferase [Acidimicrobiales bacterium]